MSIVEDERPIKILWDIGEGKWEVGSNKVERIRAVSEINGDIWFEIYREDFCGPWARVNGQVVDTVCYGEYNEVFNY